MDDISRGIATAALTLQSVILQALVSKGVLTTDEALEVVDKSLDAVLDTPEHEGGDDVIEVSIACLEHVREGLQSHLPTRRWIEEPEIFHAAVLLIDQHGEHAGLRAAKRADELLEEGNLDGSAAWRRILAAVRELQRRRRKGESLN
jgi:rhamnogalacturonyl hydrolase YesR